MLCEKCGKTAATTYVKRIINGVVTEMNLCSTCAAESGFGNMVQNSFAGLLASMFSDSFASPQIGSSVSCECCGATLSDIATTGKVGCANCYKKFYNELLPYLKRVHGSVAHTGKIPNNAPLIVRPESNKLQELREKLNNLIIKEEFESAAKVRDEIKELEKENGKNE